MTVSSKDPLVYYCYIFYFEQNFFLQLCFPNPVALNHFAF